MLRSPAPLPSLLLAAGLLAAAHPASAGALRLHIGDIDPLEQPIAAAGLPTASASERAVAPGSARTRIVQFEGGVTRAIRESLATHGLAVLEHLPGNAVVVRATDEQVTALQASAPVRWSGDHAPALRVELSLLDELGAPTRSAEPRRLEASLWPGVPAKELLATLGTMGATDVVVRRSLAGSSARVLFTAPLAVVPMLAELDAVRWIEHAPVLTRRNDSVRWIVQTNVNGVTPFYTAGLRGEGQIIGHIDGPIDMNNCYFRDAGVATPGPTHRKVVAYYPSLDAESHGTHTAATAAGKNVNGALTNAGVAYEARLTHGDDLAVDGFGDTASTLADDLQRAHDDGARIHTNSWGDDFRTNYTFWCLDIDAFSHDNEDSLVLFAATNGSNLRTPENAKNVLACGATFDTPSQNSIFSGGQGPTNDGRRKPEIFAPGASTVSASAGTICGVVSSGGTSMATPALAGLAALIRQYYVEGFHPTGTANAPDAFIPSGALLKATMLNGTVDITTVNGFPTNREGWGRALADKAVYFPGDTRTTVLRDVRNASGLETGESATIPVQVAEGEELVVTLVWTDVPAAHSASPALVNNLDLSVEAPDSSVYLGNVFSSGVSVTGGTADSLNNVEQVRIPAPAAGVWNVTIDAPSVPAGPQGYAIVISGAVMDDPFATVPTWQLFD